MKTLIPEFLRRERLKEVQEKEKKVLSRKRYFKYINKNYWTKHMDDDSIEFWVYSCMSDESWYLGKFESGKIIECDGFYGHSLDWNIQKGGARLFQEFLELQNVDI